MGVLRKAGKFWRSFLGALLWLVRAAGDADFIINFANRFAAGRAVINFLTSDPVTFALVLGGILLIGWDYIINVRQATSASGGTSATKAESFGTAANTAFSAIGNAIAFDKKLNYEMALATVEPIILLLKRSKLPVPELHKDGPKAGLLRAHRYLNLLVAPLQVGDEEEAATRAKENVPRLNAMSEEDLWEEVCDSFPPLEPLPPARSRDTPVEFALGYALTGDWGKTAFGGLIFGGGVWAIEGPIETFRHAALQGELRVWGKRGKGALFELIDLLLGSKYAR